MKVIKKKKSLELPFDHHDYFFSILISTYPCPSSRQRFPLFNFSAKCEPGSFDNELQRASEYHSFQYVQL